MNRLKTVAKATLCGLYKYSGAGRAHEALSRRAGRQFMVVLLFHRVTDAIPEDGLTVSTQRFRDVCRMLCRNFHVVPLGEVYRLLRRQEPIPPRTIAITFDDSYRDNLDAARVLAEFGLPATFFIPTSYVGTEQVFDWDRQLPRLPNLTWADVREMAGLGFEIGSHTVTHANLGSVSYNQARAEIFESKLVLEQRLGRPVRYFAYPFGGKHNVRPEVSPLIEEAGYEGALSAFGGFVRPGIDNRLLPREAVPYFHSLLNLELHLAGCLNWVYGLKRRLGRAEPERGSWPYTDRASAPEAVAGICSASGPMNGV